MPSPLAAAVARAASSAAFASSWRPARRRASARIRWQKPLSVIPAAEDDISAELLTPPVNVLRLSLHPQGLAPRIANLAQWRGHLFERLRHQIGHSADAGLAELRDELLALPDVSAGQPALSLPGAERWAAEVLSLPCFPGLRADEIARVCDAAGDWTASAG